MVINLMCTHESTAQAEIERAAKAGEFLFGWWFVLCLLCVCVLRMAMQFILSSYYCINESSTSNENMYTKQTQHQAQA